jgi:lipid-binding SYLF domain-containing protein
MHYSRLGSLLLAIGAAGSLGCARTEPPRAAQQQSARAPQVALVERAAVALENLRDNSDFAAMDAFLERARAVMIFPRVVKASLIFGGEGGNGVLLAKAADGTWSDPAFYSLGAPSVGLQIGYREATVVFFFMNDSSVQRALHSDFTLGANGSLAMGSALESAKAQPLSKPIYQLVEARGAFVGVSFDGYVVSARQGHNDAYYGTRSTAHQILIEGARHRSESQALLTALAPRSLRSYYQFDASSRIVTFVP